MTSHTTPLDFEQINADRAARMEELRLERDKTALGVDVDRPFSNLNIQKSTPVDQFLAIQPPEVEKMGIAAPGDPLENPLDALPSFGRGVIGALMDVREGTVKNVPGLLRPLAYPFVKAGQGVLAGLEWGGNVAETVAPHAVEKFQHVIPGKQELERVVAEKKKAGLSHSQAIRAAWEETNLEVPFKIPFPTTAFTPSGSIQLDFQDIIEVGFDPIELILLFGTGGFGGGLGVLAGVTGKETVGAGLKRAVRESIGVRGARWSAGKAVGAGKFAGSEVRTGAAGTRGAIAGLPRPGEILSDIKSSTGDILHPTQATEKRVHTISHMDEPGDLAPGLLPEEDVIKQISTKDWRFENLLNKLPEKIRGAENTKRYKLASGLGEQVFDRLVRLADPSAVVGDNHIARSSVLRENAIASMVQQIGVGMSYVSRKEFDFVFNVDMFGRSRTTNIKLTPYGKKKFESRGIAVAPTDTAAPAARGAATAFEQRYIALAKKTARAEKTPDRRMAPDEVALWKRDWKAYSRSRGYTKAEINDQQAFLDMFEEGKRLGYTEDDLAGIAYGGIRAAKDVGADGFMLGDILEFWLEEITEQVRKNGRFTSEKRLVPNPESMFTGMTFEQIQALNRHHKFTVDWLERGKKEGALEIADGKIVGFKFGQEATQEFGDPAMMYRYAHREAISKEIKEVATGDVEQVLFQRPRGEGMSTGRTDMSRTRVYETMEEGARQETLYAHPMEAMESMAITIAQMIGDKRAMNYLKRNDIVVTTKEAFERLYPRMVEQSSLLKKAEAAALANVNRLKKMLLRREGAKKYATGSKSVHFKSIKEYERLARVTETVTNAAERQMLRTVRALLGLIDKSDAYTAALKSGDKEAIKKARGLRTSARKSYAVNKGKFTEKIGSVNKAGNATASSARRMNTQSRHVQSWKEEFIGVTDDLGLAIKELDLVRATRTNFDRVKSQRMTDLIEKNDVQFKAFGSLYNHGRGRDVKITHFQNGPLSGSFAPEEHAVELQKTFGDNGLEALRKIEKVTGTARTLAAGSADIGWMGIQGSLLAATHPVTFAKASLKSLEAVLNPAKRDEYVRNNITDILEFLQNQGDLGSSEFFTAIDRTGMLSTVTNWLTIKEGKLPVLMPGGGRKVAARGSRVAKWTEKWGRDVKPLGRLGAGFNTFIDISKVELWKSFAPTRAAGIATNREIATYINNVMGTLNSQMLGVRQTQRQIEGGLLLFSPRFTRSAFAVAGQAMKALSGGAAGAGQIEGLATREAIRSISGMVAASTFVMGGMAMATGQWDEFKKNGLDPMKPGWLTIEIGGQRVGVGGSTRALLDMVFKSAAAMAELDGKTASDLMKWNIFDPLHRAQNPIPNFWLNRTAPGVRELLLGEQFGGEGLDTPSEYVVKGLAPKFLPFAAQNWLEPGVGNPHPGVVAAIPESVGLRARPLSVFERRAALRDELAEMAYDRKWKALDVDERNEVERLNQAPIGSGKLGELDELVETVESPTVGRYFADRKAISTMIDEELFKVANAYKEHGNGVTLREEHDRIVREAANSRVRLETSGTHEDAIKYLEGKREARLEGETLFNQLYDEYTDTVKAVDNYVDNNTGLVDWDKRDVEEKKWLKKLQDEFGKEEGERLNTRMKNNYVGLNADGVRFDNVTDFVGQEFFWNLREARETLNSVRYWQQANDVIGNNPEMQIIWNQFEASDPLTQEAMKREYRQLARIQRSITRRRDRLRKNDPAVDKALMDFYGHRAANRENIRAERIELRRLRSGGLTQGTRS